ncbi:DUF4143 domain-containing protein [Frankia sp. CcWB2]
MYGVGDGGPVFIDEYQRAPVVLDAIKAELNRDRQTRPVRADRFGAARVTPVHLEGDTANSYLRLLEAVFLLYRLPAWGSSLTARSTRSPKIHVLDSGVAARLLRLTSDKLAARSAAALTEFDNA